MIEFTRSTLPGPESYQDTEVLVIENDGKRTRLFSDGLAWRTTLSVSGSTDPQLTAAQVAATQALVSGAGILRVIAPVGIPSSGSMGANGAVTLTTALPTVFSRGVWLYFPAGAVFAGSAAGLYWVVMSSTTVGVAYNTTLTAGAAPFYPSAPTSIVAAGPGAYTQTTAADITLTQTTIPGNLMGASGRIEAEVMLVCNSSANTKRPRVFFGGQQVKNLNITTNTEVGIRAVILNLGSVAAQHANPEGTTSNIGGVSGTPIYTTIDTSVDQPLVITGQMATATDYLVLTAGWVDVVPFA